MKPPNADGVVWVVIDGDHVEVMDSPPLWDWKADGQLVLIANVNGGDSRPWLGSGA
jgi:hypothetical protein